jgi:GMP synthase-like glutamine amidotransferase
MRRVLHIQNESTDQAELFVDALHMAGVEVDVVHPYAGEDLPASLTGYAALVSGGGTVDTHQTAEHPWLVLEIELIREALRTDKPFMGLCLGAQLLTAAAHGEVYACEPNEVGWAPVELTEAAAHDPLFAGLPERFMAMQWHAYACRPPEGAVELMRNHVCTQALRVGHNAWGTQFHIEVTRGILMDWLEMGGAELERHGINRDRYLYDLDVHLDNHIEIGRILAGRFAELAVRRARAA